MPVYEFSCSEGCQDYEVWRSIESRQVNTDCPDCGAKGSRIFSPPMTLTGSFRLKQESKEPRLVSAQQQAEKAAERKPRLRESSTRPWMVNRGC